MEYSLIERGDLVGVFGSRDKCLLGDISDQGKYASLFSAIGTDDLTLWNVTSLSDLSLTCERFSCLCARNESSPLSASNLLGLGLLLTYPRLRLGGVCAVDDVTW